MNVNDVIKKPIITEKSSDLLSKNVYTLEVDSRASKIDVKIAIETIFSKSGAKVSKVNIMKVKQKSKRLGKYDGFKKGYKKAMITLSEGSIPVYGAEGVVNNEAKSKKSIKIIDTDKIMKEAEGE
ncbi:MAG: 50S ribosomal protein L23 [Mycoplasmataceae bacterium]|nr:50S ribosomal protein L23 [Mycoplasmataceae bacterium]